MVHAELKAAVTSKDIAASLREAEGCDDQSGDEAAHAGDGQQVAAHVDVGVEDLGGKQG